MKFIISKQIFEKFPDFICGVVIAKNIDNKGTSEEISQLLREEESKIRKEIVLEGLAQNPFFAPWRRAYSSFGSKPSQFRCSSEALIRRVLKGDNIRHINKLVDIYNLISLKYKTPVGGEDLDKVDGMIHLKLADGSESFVPLGSSETENPDEGEVVYADDKEVLCRRWNWRESDKTKLTEDTKNAFLVIDALQPLTEDVVRTAVNDFADLLKKFCNAETVTFVLNKNNSEIEW